MKDFRTITLTSNQSLALNEIRQRLLDKFDIYILVLYGSFVRGDADKESDIDLLIVTANQLPRPIRHIITDIVFEVNLHHDTNFSTLVVDHDSWEAGTFSVLPLRDEIIREGVKV